VPGREHGGNCDVSFLQKISLDYLNAFTICFIDQKPVKVKEARCRLSTLLTYLGSRGSRCYFPVFVKGANLSVGDLHFSQGDVSTRIAQMFPC
jgi:hypothetical protein